MANNNNQKNGKKKTSSIGAIAIIVFAILSGILDTNSGMGAFLAVIIFIAVIVFLVIYIVKEYAKTGKENPDEKMYGFGNSRKNENAPEMYIREDRSQTKQDDCGYDAANCNFSHDMKRRREQLDGFLKNGIIDKQEYNLLLERYEREMQQL